MAIDILNVHSSAQGVDANSFDFSLTGLNTGGRWLCFDVYSQVTTGPGNIPTLSGASLTYVAEANSQAVSARTISRVYAWNPSNASYTLTVAFAGQTQLRCGLQVSQIEGAELADPFVQTVTAGSSGGTSITSGTLAAYADGTNRFLGGHYHAVVEASTPSHTALAEITVESTVKLGTQWDATAQPLSPTWDWASNASWGAILSEVDAVAGGAATVVDPFGMSGFFGS